MATRNPYAEHKVSGGSGSYLKWEDGKQVVLRIVSDPAIFDSVYEGRASTKYGFIVYNISDEEVQVMQLPKTGFRALQAIAADPEYGNPMDNDYTLKITRTGMKQQTKYEVVPGRKPFTITPEIQEEIDAINLLERLEAGSGNENVAWLFDEIDGKREKVELPEADTVKDVDEEPINLDDLEY